MNIDIPRVLVLNASYVPFGIASVRRAVTLVMSETAEVIEETGEFLNTPNSKYPVPAIIRIKKQVKAKMKRLRLKRKNLLKRDNYTCQYCGRKSRELTIDHVVPRSHGGKTIWENVVAACKDCNARKADRTPRQAGMKLLKEPTKPTDGDWLEILDLPKDWIQYFRQGY